MLISNTQCFTSEMKPGIKVFNLEMSTLFCILFTVPYSLGSPAGRLFTPKATPFPLHVTSLTVRRQ